tara:strand:+ start:40094 stop:42256 length:2163 start_codon:yes stop_codon:yes gene_type:complete
MTAVAVTGAVAVAPVDDPDELAAVHKLYCEGPVLEAAQRLRIWGDSKDFVDTPTTAPASVVLQAWADEMPVGDDEVKAFIEKWFESGPPDPVNNGADRRFGNQMASTTLPDWAPEGPPFATDRFLKYIQITRGADEVTAWARDFAVKVHNMWPHLARPPTVIVESDSSALNTTDGDEKTNNKNKSVSTLLALPHSAIVPGERFRETYYWDSYWTVVGLLTCGMLNTAEGVARNLLSLVEKYGFVPNGARVYYLNRTQPPVLATIVRVVYEALRDAYAEQDASELKIWDEWPPPTPPKQKRPRPQTKAIGLIRYALPLLLKEYQYLTKPERVVRVDVPLTSKAHKTTGDFVDLSRYWAFTDQPRPESFREDVELAKSAGVLDDEEKRKRLYRDVASAAESGHDFGSRWLGDADYAGGTERGDVVTPGGLNPGTYKVIGSPSIDSLASIRTTRIVPADLNGLMLRCETDIAFIAGEVKAEDVTCLTWVKDSVASAAASVFAIKANRRRTCLNAVLFDRETNRWRDILLDENASDPKFSQTANRFYNMGFTSGYRASDYVPLWCGAFESNSKQAIDVVRSLIKSGLPMPGGIATSLRRTGHQWDYPNAWAPLVHMLVEGCDLFGGDEGKTFARETARRWIKSNAQLLKSSKHMHEKYDARVMGSRPGAGGEYTPQRGFGWTNGVVLFFLDKYVYDGDKGDFKLRGVRLERLLESVGAKRIPPP